MSTKIFKRVGDETILSFSGIIELLYSSRKLLLRIVIIFTLIGLFISLFSKKEFKTSVTFMSQSSGVDLGGNLGGLAAIAGINLSGMGGSNDIPANIYPQIVGSVGFQKKILHSQFNFPNIHEPVSYYEYFMEYHDPGVLGLISQYTIGLPGQIITGIKGKPGPTSSQRLSGMDSLIEELTFDEHQLIKDLKERLTIKVNEFDGYIQITAMMPEPEVAAELVVVAQTYLQDYVIALRSRKAREKLEFIEKRFVEKKKEYEVLQSELARWRDNNLRLTTEESKIRLSRLQSEYDVALRIYTELATQLETQKIQVKEDTPIFTTINAVSIPIEKDRPRRGAILALWIFLGGFSGVLLIVGKAIYQNVRSQLNLS